MFRSRALGLIVLTAFSVIARAQEASDPGCQISLLEGIALDPKCVRKVYQTLDVPAAKAQLISGYTVGDSKLMGLTVQRIIFKKEGSETHGAETTDQSPLGLFPKGSLFYQISGKGESGALDGRNISFFVQVKKRVVSGQGVEEAVDPQIRSLLAPEYDGDPVIGYARSTQSSGDVYVLRNEDIDGFLLQASRVPIEPAQLGLQIWAQPPTFEKVRCFRLLGEPDSKYSMTSVVLTSAGDIFIGRSSGGPLLISATQSARLSIIGQYQEVRASGGRVIAVMQSISGESWVLSESGPYMDRSVTGMDPSAYIRKQGWTGRFRHVCN